MPRPTSIAAAAPLHPRVVVPHAGGAPQRIRVLIVDDSIVMRRLVAQALETDRDIEVVGSAANGRLALERIAVLKPQAVTLDIEMPEMDGIATAREIRGRFPNLCIIMCSSLTERGAAATLEALSAGANDYVAKPVASGLPSNVGDATKQLAADLVPKIRQFFGAAQVKKKANTAPAALFSPPARRAVPHLSPRVERFAAESGGAKPERRIVAIGISTGGPNALAALMPKFPKDFPLPLLIVQHMPALFTRLLAERLSSRSSIPVEEAIDGAVLQAGKAWVAPGDFHMRVREENGRQVIRLDQQAPEHSCRPSVDVLFRSLAEVYGGDVVAAVMTGMGSDGALGAAQLHEKGAHVIAQDEASSVVWGMPGAVVHSRSATAVVPLDQIYPEILKQL